MTPQTSSKLPWLAKKASLTSLQDSINTMQPMFARKSYGDSPSNIPQEIIKTREFAQRNTDTPSLSPTTDSDPTFRYEDCSQSGPTMDFRSPPGASTVAVDVLERLTQEASNLMVKSGDEIQTDEVQTIIEEATAAMRKTYTLSTNVLQSSSPLCVSSSARISSAPSSDSDSSSPSTSNGSPLSQEGIEATDWKFLQGDPQRGFSPPISMQSNTNSFEEGEYSEPSDHSDLYLPLRKAHRDQRHQICYPIRPERGHQQYRERSRVRRSDSIDFNNEQNSLQSQDHPRKLSSSAFWGVRRQQNLPRQITKGPPLERKAPGPLSHSFTKLHVDRGLEIPNYLWRYHAYNEQRTSHKQSTSRNWKTGKKRVTAMVACVNTALIRFIAGIYAGEVPRIQYVLADERHHVIVGNVVLYLGLAISTFIFWPLPLLHGRKPYILASLAVALPLQFPQAIVVSAKRSPKNPGFRTSLLVARAMTGVVLGFANVNFITVLLDLFGASLQSKAPHQEVVTHTDVRKHGGGIGLWLGVWSWCWIGSLAIGFQFGAGLIESHTPDWGLYVTIIVLAAVLVLNVLAPETRRSTFRASFVELYDRKENFIARRSARGEIKLHLSAETPLYWVEEVWAGVKLSGMMCCQRGFLALAFYIGWIYAQIVLLIVLLGALLSREYRWTPRHVGLGVTSIAIGALLGIPLTKANLFSRDRKSPFRTDSLTFRRQLSWTSHLIRRVVFTMFLPLMGLAYTVSSAGRPSPSAVPIVCAGVAGFLSVLAIAECHGLLMETFDTCDLQPGVNTRHRLQSMAVQDRRRRTEFSSFPRVTAGIFVVQTLAFVGAAIATAVGGIMTRHIGAQASTGVTAGILLTLTVLLISVLWRYKKVQVIPNHTFGTRRDTKAWEEFRKIDKDDWKPVVIGNPSGKVRKMSILELGDLSRWSEIRRLNYLIKPRKQESPG